ncbi:MAG: hypothetical protein AAF346_16075 [Pseudomonadota bacterium]
MRGLVLAFILLASAPAAAETVIARLDTVGCTYHDVLWDKTGYDKQGKPTPEMIALDICTGIENGQKLELFEQQVYAPGGLKIVRIDDKLYFVRVRDVATERQLEIEAVKRAAALRKSLLKKKAQKTTAQKKVARKKAEQQ